LESIPGGVESSDVGACPLDPDDDSWHIAAARFLPLPINFVYETPEKVSFILLDYINCSIIGLIDLKILSKNTRGLKDT